MNERLIYWFLLICVLSFNIVGTEFRHDIRVYGSINMFCVFLSYLCYINATLLTSTILCSFLINVCIGVCSIDRMYFFTNKISVFTIGFLWFFAYNETV